MRSLAITVAAAWALALGCPIGIAAQPGNPKTDPRLREVWYDPTVVITLPVQRGVVTHVVLDPGESITEVGSGFGSDCSKAESSWCVAVPPGGHHLFIKPKSNAAASNNLAVVSDKRLHAFRLVVLPDGAGQQPIYRLLVKAPVAARTVALAAPPIGLDASPSAPALADVPLPSPSQLIAERLSAAAVLMNANYSLAEGENSQDIVPTLVFDDGRFTYFRFPNNREVPAVFHVLADDSETLVNTRMEDDLLVVDRVSRRLMLRAGSAVVGVWNEAFDIDGVPPRDGTTVAGVRRALKSDMDPSRGARP